MSIAIAIQTAQQRVASAYAKIQSKGGAMPATQNLANMPDAIDSIPGSVNDLAPGVHFIDYDGMLVNFWPSADVSGKTALPSNPSHAGLVAQGWNWDLTGIKSYMANHPNAPLYVGQMYDTASGMSEFDITLTKVTGKTVTFNMSGTKDWGDGETDAATSHTYEDYGDYTIKCDGSSIPGDVFGTDDYNRNTCVAVRIKNGITGLTANAFRACRGLLTITLPKSVTTASTSAFEGCRALIAIILPELITSVGASFCASCYSLKTISLPNGITSIGSSAFGVCYGLLNVSLPDSITSIGAQAFRYGYAITYIAASSITSITALSLQFLYTLRVFDFSKAASIPSLLGADNISGIPVYCKILVPSTLYNDWIAATNWATYADYIYPV